MMLHRCRRFLPPALGRGWLPAAAAALMAAPVAAFAQSAPLYGPVPDDPNTGGTLNVGMLVEPPALNPFHQAADARIRVSLLMYQGLFYESPGGQAVPLLAESYEVSDDGTVYTITLREDVTFHNGEEMTAEDVAYSYNYIRDPDNGSPGASDFSLIEEIEVVDPRTVRFHLSAPNASLPMTLGNKYGAVIPAGYFDQQGARNRMNSESVGTGPFELVEFNPNSNLVMARNEDYWQEGVPYLDELNFSFVPNTSSMLVALRNDRIDLVKLSRPQDVQQVEGIEGIEIEQFPSLNQKAIDLGAELEALSDVRVRQAISLAVDKQQLMEASVGDYGQVIGTVPAAMQERWGVPLDEVPMQGPDLERARSLMEEAGYGDGLDLTLTTINGYGWMEPAAVTLQEQLAKIGIDLNIQSVDLGVWIDNFRSQQMGFTFNDWASQPDPHLLFYRHFHQRPEGADFRNWDNEKASKLLDQGRAESDFEERQEIYAEFQKVLARTVPTIMLFSADYVVVHDQAVENYVQHPTGWYYGLARTYLAE